MVFLSMKATGLKVAAAKIAPSATRTVIYTTITDVLTEIALFLITRAKMNAPILTGELRNKFKYTIGGRPVKLVITNDVPYALRWHEEQFKLGPISRIYNRPTLEGGIGNKYLERPIIYWRAWMDKKLQEIPSRVAKNWKA